MRIVEKILRVRRRVIFHDLGDCYGYIGLPPLKKSETRDIKINLGLHTRADPVKTYIHECLHAIYPKRPERVIRKIEVWVWKHITPKERFLVARKLYSRRWRTK